ncbi:YjdF family protein [Paenibacillus ihbetae]|uniref:DUF2992 domain-containing protein n=1 Tax=Paenibacillus ihbetae TaxID=1870820 RepID=A0ABX3JWM8_9BACL|nr:YjdF family protein [Paenibacillus ihbetae]OOC61756.1 hypothetical protein BBD40_07760 [Paenibacillus ihbetae]
MVGKEPKDQEILDFIKNDLDQIITRLSKEVLAGSIERDRRINPKRLARKVSRELERRGVSSFAQEALKLEYAQRKKEKKVQSRDQREALKERKRELRIQKMKAKHRGK